MVYTINTGFGAPPAAMEPTPRTHQDWHQLGVGYGLPPVTPRLPANLPSQLPLLHIPSASFATHLTTQPQPVLPLSAYHSSVYTVDSSASSTSAIASAMSTLNPDDFLLPSSLSAASISSYMNDMFISTPTGTIIIIIIGRLWVNRPISKSDPNRFSTLQHRPTFTYST